MTSSDKSSRQNLKGKEILIRWHYCSIPTINLMSPRKSLFNPNN